MAQPAQPAPAQPDRPSLDQIDVVLVRPRNPLNIGAAARAMANFGLTRLTVVHPYEPHWRDARSAVQSTQILDNAILTDTVAEAVASATLVLGTASLTFRNPEQPVLLLPDVCLTVAPELARGGRLALLFGPENHGLNLEDLALCHQLLLIPTAEAQPSMNLGQAVAVCLYELATRLIPPDTITTEAAAPGASHLGTWDGIVLRAGAPGPSHLGTGEPSETRADAAQLNQLAQLVTETMEASNYSPQGMFAANRHDLDLLLRRLNPNSHDTRRLLGLFRRILWRLRRGSRQPSTPS